MAAMHDLVLWVSREMPALHKLLGPMSLVRAGELLNLVSGARVDLAKTERNVAARGFLNALQALPKSQREEIERKARDGELA